MTDCGPPKELARIARLRAQQRSMTDAERDAQRISFACGNVGLSNPDVTREIVEAAADRMLAENERLKRGDFTEEEFQNLCHHFSEEDACRFRQGCEAYQRKLFGETQRPESAFAVRPVYDPHTDSLMVYLADVPSYGRDVGNGVSVFLAADDSRVVGVEISGIASFVANATAQEEINALLRMCKQYDGLLTDAEQKIAQLTGRAD